MYIGLDLLIYFDKKNSKNKIITKLNNEDINIKQTKILKEIEQLEQILKK